MSYIEQSIADAMATAVNKAENKNADGTINWNYVDSDVYMDLYENKVAVDQQQYNRIFDRIADGY